MPAQKALVLPEEAAASSEPQFFPGFPGTYVPGEAVALATIGLSLAEARELIKQLGLPLKETTAKPLKADELPVAGEHYDPKDFEPGEAAPSLPPNAKIASADEGSATPLPVGALTTPLGAEAIQEAATAEEEAES